MTTFLRTASVFLPLAAAILACSAVPPGEGENATAAASALVRPNPIFEPTSVVVDTNVASFKAYDSSIVYVGTTDGKLWRDVGNSATRALVDTDVVSYQPIDGTLVYVQDHEGNLWREKGSSASRTLVETAVLGFQAYDATHVLVLGTSRQLWYEAGTPATKVLVDSYVKAFQGMSITASTVVYAQLTDNSLWRDTVGSATRTRVDTSVQSFQAFDDTTVFVLSSDGSLWREMGTSASRAEIDTGVFEFAQVGGGELDVLKAVDGNLWREILDSSDETLIVPAARAFQSIGQSTEYVLTAGTLSRMTLVGPTCNYQIPPFSCAPNSRDPVVVAWGVRTTTGVCADIPAPSGTWQDVDGEGGFPSCSSVMNPPCCTYGWVPTNLGAVQDPSVLCAPGITLAVPLGGCTWDTCDDHRCWLPGTTGCPTCKAYGG